MNIKTKYTSKDLFSEFGELTFGELLKSWRISEEVSQKEFALKLGISPANLCDLEKGRKIPSPSRAAGIAKRLGLPEALLVQIALQDFINESKLDLRVSIAA